MKVSRIQLEEINKARRGQNYVDLNAALAVHGQVDKKDLLEESTFVVSFELGANNEGYWTYNHVSIQFEDCVNCIKVIYTHFKFVFCSIIHRDMQKVGRRLTRLQYGQKL